MIRLIDTLYEIKTKEPLVRLFANIDILDNGKYKNILIHYIESQYNVSPNEFLNLVKWLVQNKSKYPDLLIPKSRYAYRGTSITPEQYKKIKNNKTRIEGGYTIIQAPYISASDAQSWTPDIKIAQRFAERGLFNNPRHEQGGRPAIIRAKVDDTFVGNPNLTKPIANRLSLKAEKEIFHLGKKIDSAEYMIQSADIELNKL